MFRPNGQRWGFFYGVRAVETLARTMHSEGVLKVGKPNNNWHFPSVGIAPLQLKLKM